MGDAWAPVIVFVTGILTTGAVLILRPISLKLGGYLDALTERNRRPGVPPELGQIRELLTGIDSRLSVLEERQDFAEALISAGDPRLLGVTGASAPERH